MIDYAKILKGRGFKATFQRINMLECIAKKGHMSNDDIYAEVSKIHPSLSLATVYKNIALMVEKGVLIEVSIAGEKSKYELAKDDHIHLVCTKCGEVEDELYNQSADALFASITRDVNFRLSKHQITLYGICSRCQEEAFLKL